LKGNLKMRALTSNEFGGIDGGMTMMGATTIVINPDCRNNINMGRDWGGLIGGAVGGGIGAIGGFFALGPGGAALGGRAGAVVGAGAGAIAGGAIGANSPACQKITP
jgi:hypothetical protein